MKSALLILTMAALSFSVQAESVSAGHYQAILGDCAACHGADLSGGMAFPVPVGEIYATNITPDKTHGIGNYSLEDFIRVMRQGVNKQGENLYPAMPYTAYAKMTDADLSAMYDYLMHEVEALPVANKKADITWPLSMRWPLALWNMAFHDDSQFVPDSSKSDTWNRGAYLVQGAAHCGTCHTPRGFAMQEKTLTQASEDYLSGGELAGWYAGNIRGNQYSQEELVQLLSTGRSHNQAVLGPMAEVITYSTQYFTADDINSIAVYLTDLSANTPASSSAPATTAGQGPMFYAVYCSTCHGDKGAGSEHVIPALAGNNTVTASNPASLLNIILHGGETANTETHIGYRMPGYAWAMDDQQVAELANMLRSSWGNQAGQVKAADVAKQRKQAH